MMRNIWYCRNCGGSQAVSEFKILNCIKENCSNCLLFDDDLNKNNRSYYKVYFTIYYSRQNLVENMLFMLKKESLMEISLLSKLMI